SDLHPIANFCVKKLNEWGINTQVIECPHKGQLLNQTWPNLIASLKGKNWKDRRLGFMGHLDIVPFNPDTWTSISDPLQPEIKEGKLYGRGAIDMKSGVAAQMMSIYLLKISGIEIHGELQLILTPDEEISGKYGADFLATQYPEIASATARIIAEPTGQPPIKSPAIIIGEKGANWLRLHFHGASGHGSQPKPKSNAINKAARFIYLAQNHLKFRDPKPPFTIKDLVTGMISRFGLKNLLGSILKPDSEKKNQILLSRPKLQITKIPTKITTKME
ncbi:MAG: M20 family metallopeptidase, partial [Promethearchaeota archaeon]